MNPTVRTPRIVPPKKQSSPASSAPTLPLSPVGPDALVAALRAMGIAEDLLVQIQSSIKPPAPKVERNEQRLHQLRGLIDSTEAHSARLERSSSHHPSQMELCLASRQRKEDERALLKEECRSITDGKLSPNATPPAFVVCSSKPQQDMEEDLIWKKPNLRCRQPRTAQ